MSIDRYKQFRINGMTKNIPFIKLKFKTSDKIEYYKLGTSRMDLISYKYYQDASYGWLIMLANPEYGGLEFNIPDGVPLVVPFPLETSITQYNFEIDKYIRYYGIV